MKQREQDRFHVHKWPILIYETCLAHGQVWTWALSNCNALLDEEILDIQSKLQSHYLSIATLDLQDGLIDTQC